MSTGNRSIFRKLNPARRGLRYGLLGSFLLLVLVPVIVLTVTTLVRETRLEVNNALERLEFVVVSQQGDITTFAESTATTLGGVLEDPVPRGNIFLLLERQGFQEQPDISGSRTGDAFDTTQQEFQDFTTRLIVDSNARFDRVLLLNADGYVVGANELRLVGTNFGDQVWFRSSLLPDTATETGTPLGPGTFVFGPIGDPMATGAEERLSYYFTVPVFDPATSEASGVLVGRVRTQTIANIVAETAGLGETGELLLVDDEGNVLNSPRMAEGAAPTLEGDVIAAAIANEDIPRRWQDYRGEEVLGTYASLDPLNMTLVAKQDVAEVAVAQRGVLVTNILLGAGIAALAMVAGVFVAGQITSPLEALTTTASRIAEGESDMADPNTDVVEIKQLAAAFNVMNERVNDLVQRQEAVIKDRTRQLEITAQMGRVIAAETDLERLMNITVDMIRDRLGYYHAQVFLIDDLNQFAVLRASTGEAGRALLARQHKLEVGSTSVIGRVTDSGRPVLAADTADSPVHKRNELLPDTRAELAVPLRIGDQIIGALDIQSVNAEAFDEGTISVLQTVADQLAVAIRNAQLFSEREGLLNTSLGLTRMLTRESWREYAENRTVENPAGYEYDLSAVRPIDEPNGGGATGGGATTNGGGNGSALRMPIEVRGEEIGALEAELDENSQLGEAERDLVAQVLDRMALALDNARLFNQTQDSLSETARLYDASQLIADATTSVDLANRLLSLMGDVEAVDRAMLYTLADPDEQGPSRQALYVGYYEEQEDGVTIFEMADRLQTDDPALRGIEGVAKDGDVVDDVREVAEPLGVTGADVISQAVFPLVSGGQTLGWLVLQNRRMAGAFPADDVRFFQTVADQSATVLSTARLLDQTAARARRLQAVNEVTRSSTSILNVDVLMPIVVNQVANAFGYYHVQIFRVGERGEWANLVASTGEVGQELLRRNHRLSIGSQSVIGRVTSTGEIIIARDTDEDAVHRKNELLPDTRAELAVPIKTGERVIGALDVQSTQPNAFDEEAVLILQSLADQISVALENAQLFKEIQDRVKELSTINTVSQAVSQTDTLEELYGEVSHHLVKTFGATYGFLGIVRDGMIELPVFIENGAPADPPPPTPLGEGLTSVVVNTGEKMLINHDAERIAKERGAVVVGDLPASLLIVPLSIGGSVFGAVSIQSDEEYAFDDSHERQLNTLAAYIAIKIRNNELLLDTKQAASELGFLFNMTRAAVQTTDLDDALANVANIIQYELDGAETATIYLREHDPVEGEMAMVPHASSGFASDVVRTMSLGEGLVGRSADGQEPIILQDARFEGGGTTADMRAMLVVPLVAGREVIGVISVGSTQVGVFDETDVALLQTASSTLTAVIQNAQLLEQIEATNEELRQLDQLKTQFLANMSHELRTPLNSIIGFSKVILNEIDGPLTDLQRQDLSTIHESGKHLLGLINDILDMSKIEAGKMEVHNEFMEMEDIIKGVMSTSLALVKDKPVALRDDLPSQLPVVYADSKRVRQVLLNLMSNAAKFTHEGTITLKVREYNSDPDHDMPGPHIRISVVDTGIGISEHDMPLLFEAFRQVDGSTTRQVGGTGLGLPITKEFIELMGGRIWVESEVGSGSAFNFTLPVQPPTGVETTPTGQLIDRSKPIILAVDDEPRVLDLYRRYLDNDEYSMVGVPSAQNIVERVRNVRPTLIIMDLALPGKDGWEALDEIKQEPDISHIPVIICSIHDERTRGMEAGAAGYLTKPVIEEDLLGMVDDVLEGMDLDQQTVATTMHEPVYDASEREAVKMAEAIAEERDATLEDADPVTADAEPAIAGDAHPEAEADDLDEVAQALPPDPPAGPSPVPSGPTSAPAVPREGEAIRTLIIDPDEAYAAALSDLLEETEMFDTHVTHKGFSGLGAADQNRPHVIILDVDIDDMDGLGLLAAMRSNPSTNNVPVIILTERDLTQEQLEPFADGITAYVNKLDHDADSLLMEIDEVVAILLYGFE